ncbi:MAG: CAP domain-containing protein [Solirubrobacteraceae bacterium]
MLPSAGGAGSWRVSSDSGVTWIDVPSELADVDAIVAAGDRVIAFGASGGQAAFASLAPGAGSALTVGVRGAATYSTALGGLALPDGTLRIVLKPGIASPVLATVASDGTVTATWPLPMSRFVYDVIQAPDGSIWAGAAGSSWAVQRGDGPPVLDEAGPLWIDGGAGNALYSERQTVAGTSLGNYSGVSPVPGVTGLWMLPRGYGSSAGKPLLRTVGPALLTATGLEPPNDARVVADGDRLYAALLPPARGPEARMVWSASLSDALNPSSGDVSQTAQEMVGAANTLRAEAGLPPLSADPLITKASENHSRYYTLNPQPNDLSAHSEIPGRPGFTGASPDERCTFVGALCGSEIMFPVASGPDAVRGWMATIFHRFLIGSPTASVVGAAKIGNGPAVMNARGSAGRQLVPYGMPAGQWSGPLSFAGEIPDPAVQCAAAGQPRITAPFGTAITVALPNAVFGPQVQIADISLREQPAGRLILGCLLPDGFVPDDPLEPRTTYEAQVQWKIGGTPMVPHTWSFTTAASNDPAAANVPREATTWAKLAVLRAGVRDGNLDLLARITARATGDVRIRYRSAGKTTQFNAKLVRGQLKVARRLPAGQRRKTTGIVSLTYAGNRGVRRDTVKLRAAQGKARLVYRTARIDGSGQLRVSGSIAPRAQGVVRVRLGYTTESGAVRYANYRATIARGKWAVTHALPDDARAGGQLSIQFTGYERHHIRGEQLSKAVAP